jgi:hypothetical protein
MAGNCQTIRIADDFLDHLTASVELTFDQQSLSNLGNEVRLQSPAYDIEIPSSTSVVSNSYSGQILPPLRDCCWLSYSDGPELTHLAS